MIKYLIVFCFVALMLPQLVAGQATQDSQLNEAKALNKQAFQLYNAGRYAEAEPLYKRALVIDEKAYGKNHLHVVSDLNNLALLYFTIGRYAEAEPLFKRALEIYEKAYDKDHPYVALSLNNLAEVYRNTGRYAEAEALDKRALEIKEKTHGKDDLSVAGSLYCLAELYRTTGRYAEAEPLYKRALEICKKEYGNDETHDLNSLALLYGSTGRHQEGHRLFVRGAAIDDKTKEMIFSFSSEEKKLAYMNENAYRVEAFLSHTALYLTADKAAVTDTFNTWIQWKGSVLEAQGRYLDALMYSDNPVIQKKFQELAALHRDLARLQLSKPERMTAEEYQRKLSELEKQKDALEAELSGLSQEFSLAKQAGRVTVQKLSSLLPQDSAYLDFAKTRLYDFQKNQWGTSHYLLFVLCPGEKGEVRLLDVGETAAIDQHINAYLKEINKIKEEKEPSRRILDREAQSLYALLIKPVEPLVQGKKHLFVSPDGNLNLIPFEVIVTPAGQYLLEKYQISYLGAGRDAVKFAKAAFMGGTSLVMADPDYDLGLKGIEKVKRQMGVKENRVRGEVSADLRGLYFPPLPETGGEADAIEGILKTGFKQQVRNLQREKAIEEMLYASTSPKVLHLSTHGYFLKALPEPQRATGGMGMGLKGGLGEIKALTMENPMLRSGIVLAGVNRALKEGRDDGMVSAEKILGLRLRGTELVVLSACETGVGDVQTGEGVFGLKRAFILSGARSLVMSLWSVPSAETVELMTEFYTLLAQGKTKTDALRQAKLDIMKNNPNPFYWGAFVLTGSP
jgi:CHAT domain-containing protein